MKIWRQNGTGFICKVIRLELRTDRGIYYLLTIGIGGYFLTILFNGYLRHIGLSIPVIGMLRPYLPEMFMLLILLAWLLSGSGIEKYDLCFWVYVLAVCGLSLFTSAYSLQAVLGTIRDLLEPFILISMVSCMWLEADEVDGLMKLIRNIFGIFVIAGFACALVQRYMGWEWTSRFFAGYSFYGTNADESLRIAHSWLGFKSLGTTASAESFGFYNGFAILYILFFGYKKRPVNIGLIALALGSILLSGMKTPLLISAVLIFAAVFLPKHGQTSFAGKLGIVVVGATAFVSLVFVQGSWTESSVYSRLVLWKQLFTAENAMNLIVPHNVYNFSAMAGNTGVLSFWDNAYLYLAFSLGIGGVLLAFIMLQDKYRKIMANEKNKFILYTYVFLALAGLTTCIFLGRCVLCTVFIIIGLRYARAAAVESKETEKTG